MKKILPIIILSSCAVSYNQQPSTPKNSFICSYLGAGYRRCESREITCYQILDGNFNIVGNICKFKYI